MSNQPKQTNPKSVAVVGASGFVGRALLQTLLDEGHSVVALSRTKVEHPGINWRYCDMFDAEQTQRAMKGCDTLIYLVHSMMPRGTGITGKFEDFDAIAAQHCVRAATQNKITKIIYLSGLIPDKVQLSLHLRSRLEVEQILGSSQIPLIVLRAGIVVGAGGSSWQMLHRLVKRLPIMATPSWTDTKTEPVALPNVLSALTGAVDLQATHNEIYDLGCGQQMSYAEMMRITALAMQRNVTIMPTPFFSPRLSTLWVALFSGQSQALVRPLVQSLKHTMVARETHRWPFTPDERISFETAVADALAVPETTTRLSPVQRIQKFKKTLHRKPVRAVQRVNLATSWSANHLARAYWNWTGSLMPQIVEVQRDDDYNAVSMVFKPTGTALLQLARTYTDDTIVRYNINGGLLAKPCRGTLRFYRFEHERGGLIWLDAYEPTLPWLLYLVSQNPIHDIVTALFARFLTRAFRTFEFTAGE